MAEALQDRLRGHAKAFDGLLSLIPAKMYYGEDNSDQWQKKKQTKKEAAAARRGKLDPDSELNRNAKQVMDERARSKRKLREVQDDEEVEDEEEEDEHEDDAEADDSYEEIDGVEAEKPGEGLKKKAEEAAQKQKADATKTNGGEDTEAAQDGENALSKKEQKRAAKREKKLERKAAKKSQQPEGSDDAPAPKKQKPNKQPSENINPPILQDTPADDTASASEPQSPTFDDAAINGTVEAASTTTSVSSTIPPSEKPKHIKIPADTTALRARLAAKIEALRAARKADGADGKPIRTRQELIESRRAKQEQRKQHKKEVRLQAKLEEERLREEALASNSPGIMSPAVELDEGGSFSFGRVAFSDGSQMSHDMSYILNQGKRKGPSDAKTALLKVQNAKKRLQGMDEETRNDIAEKDAWLTARRRVEGEKIRNNEAILKKTIKRKEAAKKKSGKEWGDRLKGVDQSKHDRQKKREENLKKRRDDKLLGKAGKKKKAGGAKKKSGGRPGFEGSFGVGGGKKK